DQPLIADLIDQGFSHAFDVHYGARGEVQDAFAQLRRTVGVDATMVGLAFHAHYVAVADRTVRGHVKLFVAARVLLAVDDFNDFGNYVATTLHHDPIANHHSQALDFIMVMQSCAGNGRPANLDRLQRGNRSKLSGTAHLHQDALHLGDATAGRIFVSKGPSRRFSGKSQPFLEAQGIYFDSGAPAPRS